MKSPPLSLPTLWGKASFVESVVFSDRLPFGCCSGPVALKGGKVLINFGDGFSKPSIYLLGRWICREFDASTVSTL